VLYFRQASKKAWDEALLAERTFSDSHLVVLQGRIEEQMHLPQEAFETYSHALQLDPSLTGLHSDMDRLKSIQSTATDLR